MQAQAIAEHVPYVIGMSKAIGDIAAIEFAVGFYDAIGNGESKEQAFQLAKVAVSLSGKGSEGGPVLLGQDI